MGECRGQSGGKPGVVAGSLMVWSGVDQRDPDALDWNFDGGVAQSAEAGRLKRPQ